jgi:hypothetical protein
MTINFDQLKHAAYSKVPHMEDLLQALKGGALLALALGLHNARRPKQCAVPTADLLNSLPPKQQRIYCLVFGKERRFSQ